jgi:tetratricopeptide (TPR) repeat protein
MSKHFYLTLLIALCLIQSKQAHSSPTYIDSLGRLLKTPASDSIKVLWMLDISEAYQEQNNIPKTEEYIEKAIALSNKAGYQRGKAMSLMHKGYLQLQMGHFQDALPLLQNAHDLALRGTNMLLIVQIKNVIGTAFLMQNDGEHALPYYLEAAKLLPKVPGIDSDKSMKSNIYLHLANAYSMTGNNKSAASYAGKSLAEAEKVSDMNTALMAAGNLAGACDMMGDYGNAFRATNKLVHYAQLLHDTDALTKANYRFASIYSSTGDIPKAIEYHKRILARIEKSSDLESQAGEYSNMGFLYERMNDLDGALNMHNRALKTSEVLGNKMYIAGALHNVGAVYFQKGDYQKALTYFRRALLMNEQMKNDDFLTNNHAGVGNVFLKNKQYDSAYYHYSISQALAEKKGNKEQIAEGCINLGTWNTDQIEDSSLSISGNRRTQMLQAAIGYYEKADTLAKEIGEINLTENAYSSLSNAYKLLGNYKLSMEYLQKSTAIKDSLSSQENAFKIARLEAENSLAQKDVEINQSKQETQKLKSQKLLLYGGLGLIVVGSGAGFGVYRVQRKRKESRLKAEFEKKVAEVQMQALRAQMNPHFIFNCLNSINRYIVKSDSTSASGYLTKFSKLIRSILDNSAAEMVSLDAEQQMLQLYAEMESMRFPNRFTYEISSDRDLDPEGVFIPPMLVQPYVENAIWHGLMHKEHSGHLTVRFSNVGNSMLQVIIEDNGVGREKAAELKSKNALAHKSHGMQITGDRLRIVSQRFKSSTSLKIDDLSDETGAATGTRVTILIPFQPAAEATTPSITA